MPTPLEQSLPIYHFHERHSRWIRSEPAAVWHALTTLTLDHLPLARPLVVVRHLGRRPTGPSRSLFTDGPVQMFKISPPTYAVGGAVSRPWMLRPAREHVGSLEEFDRFDEPGWVKYLTDFHLEPRNGGVLLTTETRGRATDQGARRRFAIYWAIIRPASGLIRRDMLGAVARRAELSDRCAGPSLA